MDKKLGKNNAEVNSQKTTDCTFRVVLYQPEIPANTGNIGRLCVGMNAELHIIKPMRFLITDKYVKRSGLDYWAKLKLFIHESLDDLLAKYPQNRFFYCTTKSKNVYSQAEFAAGDFFVFGPESRGIPEDILQKYWDRTITIPMSDRIRSLNLSNSVAVILYEAWRQVDFRL